MPSKMTKWISHWIDRIYMRRRTKKEKCVLKSIADELQVLNEIPNQQSGFAGDLHVEYPENEKAIVGNYDRTLAPLTQNSKRNHSKSPIPVLEYETYIQRSNKRRLFNRIHTRHQLTTSFPLIINQRKDTDSRNDFGNVSPDGENKSLSNHYTKAPRTQLSYNEPKRPPCVKTCLVQISSENQPANPSRGENMLEELDCVSENINHSRSRNSGNRSQSIPPNFSPLVESERDWSENLPEELNNQALAKPTDKRNVRRGKSRRKKKRVERETSTDSPFIEKSCCDHSCQNLQVSTVSNTDGARGVPNLSSAVRSINEEVSVSIGHTNKLIEEMINRITWEMAGSILARAFYAKSLRSASSPRTMAMLQDLFDYKHDANPCDQ